MLSLRCRTENREGRRFCSKWRRLSWSSAQPAGSLVLLHAVAEARDMRFWLDEAEAELAARG